jgi:hypothetical protein
MLTDERLDELWLSPMSFDWEHREYARLVEAEISAPLLARIAELEWALQDLVARCNNDAGLTNEPEVIAAEAALERLYKSRAAMKEQPC